MAIPPLRLKQERPLYCYAANVSHCGKEGQILRVFFTQDKPLPQDRESIFYFNFLQVPPANIGGDKGSKIVVMLKTE